MQNLKKKKQAASFANGKVRMMTSATNEECEESDYGDEAGEEKDQSETDSKVQNDDFFDNAEDYQDDQSDEESYGYEEEPVEEVKNYKVRPESVHRPKKQESMGQGKKQKEMSPDVRKARNHELKPATRLIQQFQASISPSKQEFKIEVSKIVD